MNKVKLWLKIHYTLILTIIIFLALLFITPFMIGFDSTYFVANSLNSQQAQANLEQANKNKTISTNQLSNPDVSYAEYFAEEEAWAVRLGATSNPSTKANYDHLTYFNSGASESNNKLLQFSNNGTASVYINGNVTDAQLENKPIYDIKYLDFASNTGVPQVNISNQTPNTETIASRLYPYPYHISATGLSQSTTMYSSVNNIENVIITDTGNNSYTSSYSSVEEVGFFCFSGLSRYFDPLTGQHGWFTLPNNPSVTLPFFNKLKTVTFKSQNNDSEASMLENKMGIKVVRNGAFYGAPALTTVDFGVDNRLTSFDEPDGAYPGFDTSVIFRNNYLDPMNLGDYGSPYSTANWYGVFAETRALSSVKLWQKYYGWDQEVGLSNDDRAKYHDASLLNIPAHMFYNSTIRSFNTNTSGTFAMPSSVQRVGTDCLEGARNITTIIFSNDISKIDRMFGLTNDVEANHFYFPKAIRTYDLTANNYALRTSLQNFIANNCNMSSRQYYIHIPYEGDAIVNNSLYYQTIKSIRNDQNVHISFIRAKSFYFVNWKTDLGLYNGRKDLDNIISETNISPIIVRPLPAYSYTANLRDIGSNNITISSPLRFNTENLGGQYASFGDGVALQINCRNDVARSNRLTNLKITVTSIYDANYANDDGLPANEKITKTSSAAQISFYAIDANKSFTFGNDVTGSEAGPGDGVGGNSNVYNVAAKRGNSIQLGQGYRPDGTGDFKYVTIKTSNAYPLPLTGSYAGVNVSIVDMKKANATINVPSWLSITNVGNDTGTSGLYRRKYTISVAPLSNTPVGAYSFKIRATAVSDPTKYFDEDTRYIINVWDANSLSISPAPISNSSILDLSAFNFNLDSGIDPNLVVENITKNSNKNIYYSFPYIGGSHDNIAQSNTTHQHKFQGTFVLPSFNYSYVDNFVPPDVSSSFDFSFANFRLYKTVFTDAGLRIGHVENTNPDPNQPLVEGTLNSPLHGIARDTALTDNFITNGMVGSSAPYGNGTGQTPRTQPSNGTISYFINDYKIQSNFSQNDDPYWTNQNNTSVNYMLRDFIAFELNIIPNDGNFQTQTVTYVLVITATSNAIWNDPVDENGTPDYDTSKIPTYDRPENKTIFSFNNDYIYQGARLKLTSTASSNGYRVIFNGNTYSPGSTSAFNAYDLVRVEINTTEIYLKWNRGLYKGFSNLSATNSTFSIILQANVNSSPIIQKNYVFSFWDLNESKSTIANDNLLEYPSSTTSTLVSDGSVEYPVSESTRIGGKSYIGSLTPPSPGWQPLFSQELNYNLSFIGNGAPTRVGNTNSDINLCNQLYQYDAKWFLTSTTSGIVDPTTEDWSELTAFGRDPTIKTGLDIASKNNPTAGNVSGIIWWDDLGKSPIFDNIRNLWDKLTFKVGVRIQFGWQTDIRYSYHPVAQSSPVPQPLPPSSFTPDCYKIRGTVNHTGPKLWEYNEIFLHNPASFVQYAYEPPVGAAADPTNPAFDPNSGSYVFLNKNDNWYNAFTATAYKVRVAGSTNQFMPLEGYSVMPVNLELSGTNIAGQPSWNYYLEDLQPGTGILTSYFHIANGADQSGYPAGTIWWGAPAAAVSSIPNGQLEFNIRATTDIHKPNDDTSCFSYDASNDEGYASYSVNITEVENFEYTFVDPNAQLGGDTGPSLDNVINSNNFTPQSKIVMRAYSNEIDGPNTTSIDVFIDTNVNLSPGQSNPNQYTINVIRENGASDSKFIEIFDISEITLSNPRYKRFQIKIQAPAINSSVYNFHVEVGLRNSSDVRVSQQFSLLLWAPKSNPLSSLKYATSKYEVKRRLVNGFSRFDGETVAPTYKTNIQQNWDKDDPDYADFAPFNQSGALSFSIVKVKLANKDITADWFAVPKDGKQNPYTSWFIIDINNVDTNGVKAGTIRYDINEKMLPSDTKYFDKYTFTIEVCLYDIYSNSYKTKGPTEESLIGSSTANVEFKIIYSKPAMSGGGEWIFIVLILIGGGMILFFLYKQKQNKNKKAKAAAGKSDAVNAAGGAKAAAPVKAGKGKKSAPADEEEAVEEEEQHGTGFEAPSAPQAAPAPAPTKAAAPVAPTPTPAPAPAETLEETPSAPSGGNSNPGF